MTLARLTAALNSHRVGAINLTRDSWLALAIDMTAEDVSYQMVSPERGGSPCHIANVLGHPVHLSDRDSLSVWNGANDSEVEIP